jgi:outer membrane protein assembly factor BamB
MRKEMKFSGIRAAFAVLFTAGLLSAHSHAAEQPARASWPIYHGDQALRGIAECRLPDKLSVVWRFKVGARVPAAPVVSGGKIFFISDKGEAYAISMDGRKVWSAPIRKDPPAGTNKTEQAENYSTPPLCVRDTVLVGSDGGYLHALDAANGKTRWKQKIGDNVNGTANWFEPEGGRGIFIVAISQSDGAAQCVGLDTGKPAWASQPLARTDGCPAVGKDFIVFGSCDAALHVLSRDKGEEIAKVVFEDRGPVAGGVAVVGELVFAGTHAGSVLCADVKKKKVVWASEVFKSEAFATPAVTADRVVAGSSDGQVCCLNRADGKKIWSFAAGDSALSPVVAGDKVAVSAGGTLYVLKLEDGAKTWSDKAGDVITSPAVLDGKIVIGTDDGFVIMYGGN